MKKALNSTALFLATTFTTLLGTFVLTTICYTFYIVLTGNV